MPDQNKLQQTRRAGSSGFPVTELPDPPMPFIQDPMMRAAWNKWMFQLNEWRKNIPSGGQVVSGGGGTVQNTTIIQGGSTGGDASDPNLKSIYLMAWMGL